MELPSYGVMRPNMGYYHQPTTPQPSPSPVNVPSPSPNIMPPPQQQLSPVMSGSLPTNINVPFRGNHPGLFLPRGPIGNMGATGVGYFQQTGGVGPGGVYPGGFHPSQMTYQQLPQQHGYSPRQHMQQPGHHQNLQPNHMQHFTHHGPMNHQQPYQSTTMPHQLPPPPPHPAAMLPPPAIHHHLHQQPHTPVHQHQSMDVLLDSPSANRDPVTKAKALAAAVKKSLERLFDLASKNFRHNAVVDSGNPNEDALPPVSPQSFEVALEEFVLVCNRLELQLQILLELKKTANTVYRYAPLPVTTKSDIVSPQEDGALSYNQYLTITRNQIDLINHIHSALFTPQPSFGPMDMFPGRT